MKDPCSQGDSVHRQRALCHTNRTGACPYRRSLGQVSARPFTDEKTTPHDGHAAARSSAVITCTTRPPNAVDLDALHREAFQTEQTRRVPEQQLTLNVPTLDQARDLTLVT